MLAAPTVSAQQSTPPEHFSYYAPAPAAAGLPDADRESFGPLPGDLVLPGRDVSIARNVWDAAGLCPPGSSSGAVCDCQKLKALGKAVKSAHKGVFYANDFDYLCDPCYGDWWPGDALKRNCAGGWLRWDIGGEFRRRQHAERNMRGLGLTGLDDDRQRLPPPLSIGTQVSRLYGLVRPPQSERRRFLLHAIDMEFLTSGCPARSMPPCVERPL